MGNPPINFQIIATLDNLIGSDEESCSKCAAGCLGSLSSALDDDELDSFLEQNVYGEKSPCLISCGCGNHGMTIDVFSC